MTATQKLEIALRTIRDEIAAGTSSPALVRRPGQSTELVNAIDAVLDAPESMARLAAILTEAWGA